MRIFGGGNGLSNIFSLGSKLVGLIPGLGPIASIGLQAGLGIAANAADRGKSSEDQVAGIFGHLKDLVGAFGGKAAGWFGKVIDFALGLFQGGGGAKSMNRDVG